MPKINEADFIKEFIHCLAKSDIVKAKALLQFFWETSIRTQIRVLFELNKSSDKMAFNILDYIGEFENADDKVKDKIVNLILKTSYGHPGLVISRLKRKKHINKITYIKIAGDLKLLESVPILSDMLNTTSDIKHINQIIISLGKIGSHECTTALIPYLHSEDVVIKNNVISALIEIGSDEAIEQISKAVTGDNKTDPFIVNGLFAIQTQLAIKKLNEMIHSPFVNVRNMAIDSLIKIGSKAVPFLVENLKSKETDILIHTLTILGHIGDTAVIPSIQAIIAKMPKDPNIRFSAYEALGRLPSIKSAISLANGLEDNDEQVRMAAARAIDKNLSNVLIAGLKNMIKPTGEKSKGIVSAFIDTESDNAFNSLIEWETFRDIAADYLSKEAHPDIRKHYQRILMHDKNPLLPKIIQKPLKPVQKKKLKIYAVDDSLMILKLYTKKLHIMGYEPVTFQSPVKAIDAVRKSKPDILITDLNMPDINGLQMAKEIRRHYNSDKLPIILITTQSDFSENAGRYGSDDTEAVKKNGINAVLHKPFKDRELAGLISRFTGA